MNRHQPEMKIAVYMGSRKRGNETYNRIITSLPSHSDLFILRSIHELESQLRASPLNSMVTLLAPVDCGDMLELCQLHDLLRGVRLVILLPADLGSEALNCAHSLYPRYLCSQPDGLAHLGEVIGNLCIPGNAQCLGQRTAMGPPIGLN